MSASRTGRYAKRWLIEAQMNANLLKGKQILNKELQFF